MHLKKTHLARNVPMERNPNLLFISTHKMFLRNMGEINIGNQKINV